MPTLFRRDMERKAAQPQTITPHRGADLALQADGAYYPACTSATSACRGGRLPCPTPDACRRAELVPAARLAALPKLTPAGKFWIGYVLGLLSALLLPHWLA